MIFLVSFLHSAYCSLYILSLCSESNWCPYSHISHSIPTFLIFTSSLIAECIFVTVHLMPSHVFSIHGLFESVFVQFSAIYIQLHFWINILQIIQMIKCSIFKIQYQTVAEWWYICTDLTQTVQALSMYLFCAYISTIFCGRKKINCTHFGKEFGLRVTNFTEKPGLFQIRPVLWVRTMYHCQIVSSVNISKSHFLDNVTPACESDRQITLSKNLLLEPGEWKCAKHSEIQSGFS